MNVPYKWGGRDVKDGMDCIGLVNYVRREYGFQEITEADFIYEDYGEEEFGNRELECMCDLIGERIEERSHMDIVLLGTNEMGLGVLVIDGDKKIVVFTDGEVSKCIPTYGLGALIRGYYRYVPS